MRVLITRAVDDAAGLAALVRARGHEPVLAPLIDIRLTEDPPTDDVTGATLLFTSANGARAAKAKGFTGAALVVGAATAEAARAVGFAVAGVAEGDAAGLARLVAKRLAGGAALLHVSGSDIAGDLVAELTALGYAARRYVAYRAIAAARLPEPAAAFLKGEPGAALLYSPRTARLLVELTVEAGLAAFAARHCALALSPNVAAAAAGLPWTQVLAAKRPETEAILDLLKGL
jgi:uroporphyrinogen-III synthase